MSNFELCKFLNKYPIICSLECPVNHADSDQAVFIEMDVCSFVFYLLKNTFLFYSKSIYK